MIGDVVSLKLRRKQKARVEKESAATANRAKFGRTKNERKAIAAKQTQDRNRLDGHKRDKRCRTT